MFAVAALHVTAQSITAPINQINAAFAAQKKTIDSLNAVVIALRGTVVTPPPVIVTPPGTAIAVGTPGKALTIDGAKTAYKAGAVLTVKPGNYPSVLLQNLTSATVDLTGVMLDGVAITNKNGFYNVMTLGKLTHVSIVGGTTQNIGYFSMYITGQLTDVTLTGATFKNCVQGWHTDKKYVWDGTDATLIANGLKVLNCTFNAAPLGDFSSVLDGKNVTNLLKGLELGAITFININSGEIINAAVDGYTVHDNKISNIDATSKDDIRLFKLTGNGDAYNNTFTNIYGHALADWSCSYGATIKTSHYYNNTVNGSRKYAMFEFHEYAAFVIPGKTTKAHLIIDGNTADNLGTDGVAVNGTDFAPTFIDNYAHINAQDGALGGNVTLTNNKGSNWTPAPKLPVLWNLIAPDTYSNNTYGN